MSLQRLRVRAVDDLSGASRFLRCAVRNEDKLAGLERRLVMQNALLRHLFALAFLCLSQRPADLDFHASHWDRNIMSRDETREFG